MKKKTTKKENEKLIKSPSIKNNKKKARKVSTRRASKRCLFLCPFGEDEVQRKETANLKVLLEGIFDQHSRLSSEYIFSAFDELYTTEMSSPIFKEIIEADLVIADLRYLNPNVFYELGLRHAVNKPIIHLKPKGCRIPWDLDKNFVTEYESPIQLSDYENLFITLTERILRVLESKEESKNFFNQISGFKVSLSSGKASAKDDHLLTQEVQIIPPRPMQHWIPREEYIEYNQMITNSDDLYSDSQLKDMYRHLSSKLERNEKMSHLQLDFLKTYRIFKKNKSPKTKMILYEIWQML